MPVTLVQEADAASSSVTLGAATTAGNTVVVAVACLGSTSATGVTGITLGGLPDNFTLVSPGPSAQDTTSPNDFINVSVWADANCAGGPTAISVTGTGVVAAWAYEFSGLAGTADIAQVLAVPTYQDSWVASTTQTIVPAEAWIAITAAANQAGSETLTLASTGWTAQTAHNGTSGSYFWGALAGYQTVNTVGTPSWNGNFSQASFSVTVIVTFGVALLSAPGAPVPPAAAIAPGVSVSQGGLTVTGAVTAGSVGASNLSAALAPDAGFAAWSYDYVMLVGTNTALPSAGNVYLVMCSVRAVVSFSAIRYWITGAAGSGLTAGQNFIGVYSSAGNLICPSADMTATWSGTGVMDYHFPGAPFTMSPPFVWVAFACNGTTGPSVAATFNGSATLANGRLPASRSRFGQLPGTFTSLPSSFSPLSVIPAAKEYWVALY